MVYELRIVWLLSAVVAMVLSCTSGREESAVSPAVTVAPFEIVTATEGREFASRAFSEAVAINLAQAEGLRVSQSSSAEGEEGYELTGRIDHVGREVRTTADLTDRRTGETVEALDFSSRTGDLSHVAVCLAREAGRRLGATQPARYSFPANVVCSPDAPEERLMLETVEAWQESDPVALLAGSTELLRRKPESLFSQVLSAAALAQAWDTAPTQETMDELKRRFEEMDRLDPANPYADMFLAFAYRSSGEPRRAKEIYDSLLAREDLSPAMRAWVDRQSSYALLQTGDAVGARRAAEESVRLDPVSASGYFALSRTLEALGELDEAARSAESALALEPLGWRYEQRLGLVLVRLERTDDAIGHLDRACRLSGRQDACANLAVAILRAGRPGRAASAATHAQALVESSWGLYNLACYQALAGESEAALGALTRALDQGFADHLIATDSDLDSLRGLPEFEAIVAEATLRSARRKEITINAFPLQ